MTASPLPPLSRQGAAETGRRDGPPWGSLLLGGLLFVGAFAVGLWLAFPVEWFRQAIARELQVYRLELAVEELTLSPTLALHGRRAVVRFHDPGVPPLAVEEFTVRPLWRSLLSGDPGVRLQASLLQGQLDASLYRSGQLRVQTGQLLFNLPIQGGLATLQGTLEVGELLRTAPGKGAAEGTFSLRMADCTVGGPLFAAAAGRPVTLGKVTLEASGRGAAFTITRLDAGGGELLVAGTGTLLIGNTPADSRLTLNLQVRPTAQTPPELVKILESLGSRATDGSYPVKIGGPLAQPLMGKAPASGGDLREE